MSAHSPEEFITFVCKSCKNEKQLLKSKYYRLCRIYNSQFLDLSGAEFFKLVSSASTFSCSCGGYMDVKFITFVCKSCKNEKQLLKSRLKYRYYSLYRIYKIFKFSDAEFHRSACLVKCRCGKYMNAKNEYRDVKYRDVRSLYKPSFKSKIKSIIENLWR